MSMKEHRKNIGLIYLGLFVFLVVSISMYLLVRMVLVRFGVVQIELQIIVNWIMYYAIGMPIFMYITKRLNDGVTRNENGESMTLFQLFRWIAICMGIVYISNFILLFVTQLIKNPSEMGETSNSVMNLLNNTSVLGNFLLIGIIGPILEEFFFRRTIYSRVEKYGDKVYILVSAACFSLFHLNFDQTMYAFLIGAVLAYIYARTGKFAYVAIMHIAINCTSVVSQLFLTLNITPLLMLWTVVLLGVAVYGIISGITVLVKKQIVLRPSEYDTTGAGAIKLSYFNGGFLLLLVTTIAYTVAVRWFVK